MGKYTKHTEDTVISPYITYSSIFIGRTVSGNSNIVEIEPEPKPEPRFMITFEMNGHGIQIPPVQTETIPNPLPIPKDEKFRYGGWFLDTELTAKAIPGTAIEKDTTLYLKWISKTLTFYIASASDTSLINRNDIKSIKINDIIFEGEDLDSHYNSETGLYSFYNFTADNVVYSITVTDESEYKNLENIQQPFEALNGKRILLYPKVATLGDINISLNWTPIDNDRIFDMYTLVYQGEAPNPGEEPGENRLTHISYSKHNTDIHIPKESSTDGINLNYDTDLAQTGKDWNPGETMKITLDSGKSLESVLRTYSFVCIANDYNTGKPGTKNPTSNFAQKCPDMTWTIKIGDYIKTISLNVPVDSEGETGDTSSNWIAFKTRILGAQEDILPDLSNIVVEFTNLGYSLFDGTNEAKTITYNLTNGGE